MRLVPVYHLVVARDYVRSVSEYLILPTPAGNEVSVKCLIMVVSVTGWAYAEATTAKTKPATIITNTTATLLVLFIPFALSLCERHLSEPASPKRRWTALCFWRGPSLRHVTVLPLGKPPRTREISEGCLRPSVGPLRRDGRSRDRS